MNRNKLLGKMVEAGYSIRSFAPVVGITENTLCDKINGKRPFSTDEVLRICDALQITDSDEKVQIFLNSPSKKWDTRKYQVARGERCDQS